MNNLGGMIFVVSGIALGYWVVTGHATQFLQAVQGKAPQQQQPNLFQQGWNALQQSPLQQEIPNTGAQTLQDWWNNIWHALNQTVPQAPWIRQAPPTQQPQNPNVVYIVPSDMITQNQPDTMYYG